MNARVELALLLGIFATLPLTTAGQEIAMAIAMIAALVSPRRAALWREPWGRAAFAVALTWLAAYPSSGDLREALGHAWPLAPLFVIPALRTPNVGLVVRIGLGAACVAAAWAVAQRLDGEGGTAGMSHHLTLAYALLPPLGVAAARGNWAVTALLLAGVGATGSSGALVGVAVTLLGARAVRPVYACAVGCVVTVAALPFADRAELLQRAVLWTGGLAVAADGPAGPGGYAAASAPAYDALVPGFWFPNHAHDAAIQLLAVVGPAGLVAMAALVLAALGTSGARPTGAAAGLAGVVVGGLTQDVFGDLEVVRAVWGWVALLSLTEGNRPPDPDTNDPC